jgi:hypothetical protein
MSNYSFAKLNDDLDSVLNFWKQSPDATVFTHPEVLPHLVENVEWWMAFNGLEPVCLWPVCGPDFRNGGVSKFAYYVGPFWGKIRENIPLHRWLEMSRKVYRGYINKFQELDFMNEASFPLTLTDIREFLWINTELNSGLKLELIPRFTAIINNLDMKSEGDILALMKKCRRKDIKDVSMNHTLIHTEQINPDELYHLYKSHFEQRAFNVPESEYQRLKKLCDLVNNGFGYFFGLREKNTNDLISIELVLHCDKVANAIINLTREDYRDSGAGTAVIHHSVIKAKELGLKSFDFNGANSPHGAFFKHSLGAVPSLYFDLKFNRG